MFNIDDYVMYNKDVCKIKNIVNKFGQDYYELRPISDESLKINIPISNSNNNLRNLISKDEVLAIINKIPEIKTINIDDKYIEGEYKTLLKNSTHEDLISIIKTIYLRNNKRLKENKKVSEKDKNYFELAEKYLYNEFSIVLGMNFDEVKDFIIKKVRMAENG